MINSAAHKEAVRIAAGETPADDIDDKTLLYGLLGRAFDRDSLRDLLGAVRPSSFFELNQVLAERLSALADQSFMALPDSDRQMIEDVFKFKYPHVAFVSGYGDTFARGRMAQGAINAADVHTITLRTLAKKQAEGEILTMSSLLRSGRVPRRLAMMHLYDLDMSLRAHETWSLEDGGDGGPVFSDERTSFDPDKGLAWTWPAAPDNESKQLYGPATGCPAAFIKDYILDIHQAAVQSALSGGLLKLS